MPLVSESTISMQPPAPDILCTLKTGGQIAYELVELIDQGYARNLNTMFETKKMLDRLPARLPDDLSQGLRERFPQGAMITFDFTERLPLRDREKATLDALRWLLALQGALDEHIDVTAALRERVSTIHVHAWDSGGLQLDASSYSRLTDPTLERLRKKFRKEYTSEHPVELLMYTEIDLLFPDSTWRPTVEPFIVENLNTSPFRRVWLFKCNPGEVAYVYPPYGQQA